MLYYDEMFLLMLFNINTFLDKALGDFVIQPMTNKRFLWRLELENDYSATSQMNQSKFYNSKFSKALNVHFMWLLYSLQNETNLVFKFVY